MSSSPAVTVPERGSRHRRLGLRQQTPRRARHMAFAITAGVNTAVMALSLTS